MKIKTLFSSLLAVGSAVVCAAVIPVENGVDLAVWNENNINHVAVSLGKADRVNIYAETAPEKYALQKTIETPQPYGLLNGDFDGDGKMNVFEKAAEAMFLNDILFAEEDENEEEFDYDFEDQ